jgi:hypothetical protein
LVAIGVWRWGEEVEDKKGFRIATTINLYLKQ